MPVYRKYNHKIQHLGQPKKKPIYWITPAEQEALHEYILKMLSEGKIQPSSSAAGSPVLFIPKNNGKSLSLCVDYR